MEVSPNKSETMAIRTIFGCKIVVVDECLQEKRIFNISVVIFPMDMNTIFNQN